MNALNPSSNYRPTEHSELLAFCHSVSSIKPAEHKKVTIPVQLHEQQVSILIQESSFCFTGESSRYAPKELAQIVEMYGGIAADSVTVKLHYLVICDVRNPAWAFEMYGRQVEKAMNMKKKGAGPEMVFEENLLAALTVFGFLIPDPMQKLRNICKIWKKATSYVSIGLSNTVNGSPFQHLGRIHQL